MSTKRFLKISGVGCGDALAPVVEITAADFEAYLRDPAQLDLILLIDGKEALAGHRRLRDDREFVRFSTPLCPQRQPNDKELRHAGARVLQALALNGAWMTAQEAFAAGNPLAAKPSDDSARVTISNGRLALDEKLRQGVWESIDFEPATSVAPPRYRFRPGRAAADRLGIEPLALTWCIAWSEIVEGEVGVSDTITAAPAVVSRVEARGDTDDPSLTAKSVENGLPKDSRAVAAGASTARPLLIARNWIRRPRSSLLRDVEINVHDAVVVVENQEAILLFALFNRARMAATLQVEVFDLGLQVRCEEASTGGPRFADRGVPYERMPCAPVQLAATTGAVRDVTMVFSVNGIETVAQAEQLRISVTVKGHESDRRDFLGYFRLVKLDNKV